VELQSYSKMYEAKLKEFLNKNSKKADFSELIKEEKDAYNILLLGKEEIIAFFRIRYLDWDSRKLELDVYNLENLFMKENLKAKDSFLIVIDFLKKKAKKKALLKYKADSKNLELVNELFKMGFSLNGIPVTLTNHFKDDIKLMQHSEIKLRDYKKEDLPLLKEMSKKAFIHASLYHNEHIEHSKADNLYSAWIENCCNGRAEKVFVAELYKKPVGYIACKIYNKKLKEGRVDIISVSPDARYKGIGSSLINHAVRWFKDKVDFVFVHTEAMNYPSVRAYEKSGFRLSWTGLDITYLIKS